MSKNLLFKILIALWVIALLIIGIIKYRNSRSCSTCQANILLPETLTDSQREMLRNRQAVLLYPDNSEPIFITEDTAYSRSDITAFCYDSQVALTEEDIESAKRSILYRKYLSLTPLELRPLLQQRKLAVLQSKDGHFFTVALSDYLD